MAIPFLKGIDVSGTVDLGNLTIDGAQGTDGQVLTSTGSGIAWEDASGGASLSGGAANKLAIWTSATALTNDTNLHWDTTNDRLGIGAGTPTARLHVSGTNTGAAIDWSNTTSSTGRNFRWVSLNSGGFAIEDLTAGGANRLTVGSTGNVGIGAPTPGSKLHVNGDFLVNNTSGAANGSAHEIARLINTTSGATSSYMYIGASSGNDWRVGKNILGTSGGSNFGIALHAGSTLALEIDGSSNVISNVSSRAPIFYDSNNTGYYVNPASTSNLNALTVNGVLTVNNKATVDYLELKDQNGTVESNFHIYGWDTELQFTKRNLSTGAWAGNLLTLDYSTNKAEFTGDVEAPGIYVGSTNTSYDFYNNGTSYLNGAVIIDDSLKTEGPDGGLVLRTWTGSSDYGMLGTANMSGSEYSLLTNGTHTYISAGASGNVYIRAGNNHSNNQIELNTTKARFYGYAESDNSLRAPIFYDKDNTSYYLNPASTSVFNGLTVGGSTVLTEGETTVVRRRGTITSQDWNTYIDGTEAGWYQVNNASGSNKPPAYTYGTELNFSSASANKLQIYAPHNATDGNGVWIRTGWNTDYDAWREIPLYGMAPYSGGDLRASIFYDSNNTSYYTDPASTSIMNVIKIAGDIRNDSSVSSDDTFGVYFSSDRSSAYAIFRESGAWSSPYPDLRIAFHTGIKLGANSGYNGIRFYTDYDMSTQVMSVNNGSDGLGASNVYVNNSLQAGSSLRAPIFYDSNNTGHYLDPASSSVALNINGKISQAKEDWDIDGSHANAIFQATRATQTNRGSWPGSYYYGVNFGDRTKGIQLAASYSSAKNLYFRSGTDNSGAENGANVWKNWRQIYHDDYHPEANNADTVDNLHAASFLRSDTADTATGIITINNDLYVGTYSGTTQARLFLNGTTANKQAKLQCTNGNLHIDSEDGHSLYLNYYEGTTDNVIIGNGNGGSSNTILKSTGRINAGEHVIANNNVYSGAGYFVFGTSTGEGEYIARSGDTLTFYSGGAIKFDITPSNGVHVRNGTSYFAQISNTGVGRFANDVVAFYNFSDKRLKTNIKPTTDNLDKVLKLNPVEYNWKEGYRKDKKEIGLIAQEVEKIIPEVVRENQRLNDDTLYKQVDYEHLVSTLIGAVQEQQKQIDELKSIINGRP